MHIILFMEIVASNRFRIMDDLSGRLFFVTLEYSSTGILKHFMTEPNNYVLTAYLIWPVSALHSSGGSQRQLLHASII